MFSNSQPRLTDSQDAEIAQYRVLPAPAAAGLILGLLSPVAMIDPLLWIVPPLGIVFSGLALRQISRGGQALTGYKVALWGLALSLFFGTAAPVNWFGYRWMVRREARQFAGAWFEFLAHDQPQKAHQLIRFPQYRQPLDEELWEFYRGDPRWEGQLWAYVDRPLVRTLLALGRQAQVRYYQTAGEDYTGDDQLVDQVFAVTYQQAGRKRTFFVSLEMERTELESGRANWRLVRTHHDLVPSGL
jgi:hypothetical protein